MTTDQLHDLMAKYCGSDVGCCFSRQWLVQTIDEQLKLTGNWSGTLQFPTTFPDIDAALAIAPGRATVSIKNGNILLTFSPTLVFREKEAPQRPYNQVELSFDPVRLSVIEDDVAIGNLRFELADRSPRFNSNIGPVDEQVVTDNGMTVAQFEQRRDALLAGTNVISILSEFVDSLPFPRIMDAMQVFKIGMPYRFYFESDYILVAGRPIVSPPGCQCAHSAGLTATSGFEGRVLEKVPADRKMRGEDRELGEGTDLNGFELRYSLEMTPPSENPAFADPPFAFYYPNEFTFEVYGRSAVGPGVGASDRGRFSFFRWDYNAFARLLSLALAVSPGTYQIHIDAPLDVFGSAGVSLKVGCVMIPLIRSDVIGRIDPNRFTLTFNVVNSNGRNSITVGCGLNCNAEIWFDDPPMIDILLNVLLGSFGNRLISRALGDIASKMSFRLVDIPELGSLPYPRIDRNLRDQTTLIALQGGG